MSQSEQRHEIDLPAGRIRYREAGQGKPVVFVHGYLVDGRLWDGVVDRLSDGHRCLAPDWPIGAQQIAIFRRRGRKVGDDNGDVVQAADHGVSRTVRVTNSTYQCSPEEK